MCDEGLGRARSENNRSGLVHVCSARCEGGPGFVNGSVRTITNARQVAMRVQRTCMSTHRHARAVAHDMSEKVEQTGTWVSQVAQAIEEQRKEDEQVRNKTIKKTFQKTKLEQKQKKN